VINWPSDPYDGQIYTQDGRSWMWHADLGAWTHAPGRSGLPVMGSPITITNDGSAPVAVPAGVFLFTAPFNPIRFADNHNYIGSLVVSDGSFVTWETISLFPVTFDGPGGGNVAGGGIPEPDTEGQFLRAWDGSDGSWVEPPQAQPMGPPIAQAASPRMLVATNGAQALSADPLLTRIGNQVTWNFQGTKSASGNTANTISLAEIPVGFRPTANVTQAIQVPAGNITAQMYTSGTNVFANAPGTNATTGNTRWSIRFSNQLAANAAISANVSWQTGDTMPS